MRGELKTRLTRREREVVAILSLGRTNKEIGESMGISENTVRNHLASIFRKNQVWGAGARLQVALQAHQGVLPCGL